MGIADNLRTSKILIVEDEPGIIALLEFILEDAGYSNVVSTTDPRQAVDLYLGLSPDLILLDLHMPHKSGLEVMWDLRELVAESFVPVLMLTGDISQEAKVRALATGAKDFLQKPFDNTEVRLRIRNLLETRYLYQQLEGQNNQLEQLVRERTSQLEDAKVEILKRLALAAEFRDDQTGRHTERVGMLSGRMAEHLGLSSAEVETIRRAAPLHDVGKIGIPDSILLKPARLSQPERELMKKHTRIGARLLSNSISPILQVAEGIAETHHERADGRGYWGISGDEIPIAGRIVAVADVFDALVHVRPYKEAWPVESARNEIRNQAGAQFDPDVVESFLMVEPLIDLRDTVARHR